MARVRISPSAGIGAAALAFLAVLAPANQAAAQSRQIIRDAEIEALVRDYSVPLFKAAGLTPGAVEVIIVADNAINAFVTGGQRMFIHTGLLTASDTPNEVIGVLAHETGHIAGGHLARTRDELERASIASTVAAIAGAAVLAGGALTGNSDIAASGSGIMRGGQEAVRRNFLAYAREQESAADQAALRYLAATGQSAKGMLQLFENLSDQMLVAVSRIDPYVLSHPLPRERIAILEELAHRSPYFDRPDPPGLQLRHDLMRAKIIAYLGRSNAVLRGYQDDPDSLPAIYGRAITFFRGGDLARSIGETDRLIAAVPDYPYFHELKGQALLESGRAAEAIPILQHAVELAPNSPLIRILLAQAMITTDESANVDAAIGQLSRALQTERRSSTGYRLLAIAYNAKGDTGRAELASANEYVIRGDITQAKNFARRAKDKLARGTAEWQVADDIENIRSK